MFSPRTARSTTRRTVVTPYAFFRSWDFENCPQAVSAFDPNGRVSYTRGVHRAIALVLGVALLSTTSRAADLHVHDYADHDHPEHHHGRAAHEHHAVASHDADEGVHVESCNPGQHAISLVIACAAPSQTPVVDAEFVAPAAAAPELERRQPIHVTDVRVHGPPLDTQTSPRAPPPITHT